MGGGLGARVLGTYIIFFVRRCFGGCTLQCSSKCHFPLVLQGFEVAMTGFRPALAGALLPPLISYWFYNVSLVPVIFLFLLISPLIALETQALFMFIHVHICNTNTRYQYAILPLCGRAMVYA